MASAVAALQDSIGRAITGDLTLGAFLDRRAVFTGAASPNSVLPYVVLADAAEEAWNRFGGKGNSGTQTLHLWASTHEDALFLYTNVERILGGKRLPIEGHRMVMGTVRLVMCFQDPSRAFHAVVEYTVLSQTAEA